MNAIEVILDRIADHVETWPERAEVDKVWDETQEVAPDRDARTILYSGHIKKNAGVRSETIPFTCYVYDDPYDNEGGYTQVTVNFPGSTGFDPINYLYYYDSGEELRLTSN